MVGCLYRRLCGGLSCFYTFLGRFDRPFGGGFYRFSCASGRLFYCLFRLPFCSYGLGRGIGNSGTVSPTMADGRAATTRIRLRLLLLGSFHRPFRLKIGNLILCLDDILLCGLHTFLPLLIKLMDTLVLYAVSRIGHLIGSVLGGRAFLRIIALLRLVLCFGIGRFHTLRSNRRLVNGLYRTLDRISGLYIRHTKPPFPEVLRSYQDTFFATTTSLPFWAEYSQVERVMSLSPYFALTPVSYRASSLHFPI